MKTLLLTRRFPQAVIAAAEARFAVTVLDRTDGLSSTQAAAALQDYDAILCTLGDRFDAAALSGDLRCQVVASFGVGFDHLDVKAAQAAGVQVSNTPDVVTDATADLAITLILMAARRAGEGERMVRAGQWTGWHPTQLLGTHVTGKRLGIVGMGRIGQAVARRVHHGFGMEVAYVNRSARDVDLPATRVADLDTLMAQSDVVVVTVPGGGANGGLIGAAALARLRDGAIFVNVARGDVVDEAALIAELQTGRIRAGLDVYAREPVVPTALTRLENVVLLPHLGTAALEVREAMGLMALENIIASDEGRPLPQALWR
ncbi:Lactate dehydrogenase [Loktanella fryxellensis]|uniref:Lactate dehydrogenase n=1 Tax=Loktanella fryxellensis TaxID=245187 RepID=A0A1H8ERL5_9RHOB|nr:D-glycerate dehydrogenase [Loktanella fryxellensis]SEN22159.1 Lactate dehydrogenase [Loktanella fryxellensis]